MDTTDFETALQHEDSKRRFFVVEDELELATILNAPLEKWRIFLHPSQRKLVERHWNGPVRVLGGAGTGKTVVAMHRARWLADTIIKDPVVCQDHMVGNFRGVVKPAKSAKMMS